MMLHRVRLVVALLSVSSNGPALRLRCTDAWSSPPAAAAPGLRLVRRPSSSPSSAWSRPFVPRFRLLHGGPHSARSRRAWSPPLFLSAANDGDDDGDDSAAARAERLRALAARTRLEAERLESSFALEQIAKLEARLEKATTTTTAATTTEDSDTEEVRAKIAALKRRLDPQPSSSATAPPPSPALAPAPEATKEERGEEKVVDEELQLMIDGFTDLLQDYEEYMSNRTLVVELNEEDKEALHEVKEVANAFGELFKDEEVAEEMAKEFREAFGEWVVTANNSNATTTDIDVDVDGEVNKTIGSVVAFFDGMLTGANVTGDELEMLREVGGFLGGLKKFSNVSLAEEIKLSIEEDRRIAELSEADPTIVATIEALQATFPRTAIDMRNAPDRNDVDRFLDELVRRDPTALELTGRKPRDALFGFRIDGVNRLDDGDALVNHLEATLEDTDLTDELQCFWVRLPVGGDELTDVQLADATTAADAGNNPLDVLDALEETLNPPTLLVLGPRVAAPAIKASDVLGSNALGIATVAYFALSCLASADDGASTLESVVAGAARAPPLFGAILATQVLHEMGHFLAASVNKIELGFPAIVPWPWTGLLGGTTSFKSPPRNANALFDTAAAGPIAGMISSIAFLVVGLKLTLAADQDLLSNLPRLPLETLQQTSSLTSAIVESVMGFDVLSSLDPTSTAVPCHPLTIAGYVGIIANGLSFLPMVGSTDGGRMSRALFGKTDIGQGLPVLAATGFLLVQGFRGWGVSKLLLLYLFFCNVFYDEKDLPCINDVDKAGGPRCVIFLATSALAFVALSPVL